MNTAAQDEPLRKLNPNPKKAYRITLTIRDAPGPLVLTDARAQYDVTNENVCGQEQPSGGVYRMTSSELLELTRISETQYEGTVYADRILDEDYYGFGVCHWEFTQVRGNFRATGNPAETVFVPSLDAEKLLAGQSETNYFWNGGYPRSQSEGFPDFGDKDRRKYNRRDGELFTITLSAKGIQP